MRLQYTTNGYLVGVNGMAAHGKDDTKGIAPRTNAGRAGIRPWGMDLRFPEMGRWLDEVRRDAEEAWGLWPDGLLRIAEPPAVRVPALDVRDDGTEIVVTAELPGVRKEDLEVEVSEEGLTLTGRAESSREEKDGAYVYRERSRSAFGRTVPLPAEVVADQAVADLKDGVLEVRLPRRVPAPRAKPVKVKLQ